MFHFEIKFKQLGAALKSIGRYFKNFDVFLNIILSELTFQAITMNLSFHTEKLFRQNYTSRHLKRVPNCLEFNANEGWNSSDWNAHTFNRKCVTNSLYSKKMGDSIEGNGYYFLNYVKMKLMFVEWVISACRGNYNGSWNLSIFIDVTPFMWQVIMSVV